MSRNGDYWKKRFEQLEDEQYRKSSAYIKDIERQFQRAQIAIQADIEQWYWRLADNNEISYAKAKKLLKKGELEEFKWMVDEYIKFGKENAMNQKWMKKLENASAKIHISRLEVLKTQVQQECERLYQEYHGGVTTFLNKTYAENFYHTAFELAVGTGVGENLAKIDAGTVKTIIEKPWAQDGKMFSDRIWQNKDKLVRTLHTELTQCIIRGENPYVAAEALKKKMNVSMKQASTLVYTESAAIAANARHDSMKELGIGEFQVVETLDDNTCSFCGTMDGKHFLMSDYQIGVTVPPFHPRCRGCTCPYFDDEFSGGKRAARDADGKIYYVDSNMTYPEWKKTFVDSGTGKRQKTIENTGGFDKIKLSDDELHALNQYMSFESYNINEKIRNGTQLSETEMKFVRYLDDALDKMPEYQGTVYRSVSDFGIDSVDAFVKSHVVGEQIMFQSYVSSSEVIYDESFPIQYVIQSKHGRDIRPYNSAEKEILFRRKSVFWVTKVDGNTIYLEEN